MVWNICIGQLGSLSGYTPSDLLHICSFAENRRLEKILDFIAAAENISVSNLLPVLNPKHSGYQ